MTDILKGAQVMLIAFGGLAMLLSPFLLGAHFMDTGNEAGLIWLAGIVGGGTFVWVAYDIGRNS